MYMLAIAIFTVLLIPKAAPWSILKMNNTGIVCEKECPSIAREVTATAIAKMFRLLNLSAMTPLKGRTMRAVIANIPATVPAIVREAPILTAYFGKMGCDI
jgi:hypothetical protein